ncbi:hypothetical protein GCM10010269_66610 [Streptomyces humidus]|uniref:CBM2 domain-containing protein n=1 Tax=Streptomyces humidus TaxID=52259 RepID=A0A918G5G0_9ACTN|nr:cellulose binding domain-containing protein [Streptomyces humidus]GGS18217.1 hypothetical protein GCM10010269_66610 [Streptomyces humidus]
MRHPPRFALSAVDGTVALAAGALLPVVTAQGAVPARPVEYFATGRRGAGFRGAVRITDHAAAVSGRSLVFDVAGGRMAAQGRSAGRARSGTTVTAVNESRSGSPGSGASVGAGFVASGPGANAAPTTPARTVSSTSS